MSLAPGFKDLNEKMSQNKSEPVILKQEPKQNKEPMKTNSITIESVDTPSSIHTDLSFGFSKVGIIGAGGAGKIAAIRASKLLSPSSTRITTIDTSGVDTSIENVESIKIKDLNGSGKLRRENIEPISNFIADYVSKASFEDVTIIINSLSGGSGSIIGSLITDEIIRQNKIVIMIGIIDTDSEIDTTNAFNSLRSYNNIIEQRKWYLPTVLFDNNFGRPTVDKGIDTIIQYLTTLLTTPYIGLDKQDRVKFLNPHIFDSVEYGMKLICITNDQIGDWDKSLGLIYPDNEYDKLDAILSITKKDNHLTIKKLCSVTFKGYYEEGTDFVASIGYQIPQNFVATLNDKIHNYKSVGNIKKTSFDSEYDIGEKSNKGIIL